MVISVYEQILLILFVQNTDKVNDFYKLRDNPVKIYFADLTI